MMHSPIGEITFHVPTASPRRLTFSWFYIQKQRTWSQSCHSFHILKAFALPGKSKRATLKAPRMCIHIICAKGLTFWWRTNAPTANDGCNTIHPWGVLVALFLTYHWVCEVQDRQNQSARYAFIICMCQFPPQIPLSGLSARLWQGKFIHNPWNCKFFHMKNVNNRKKFVFPKKSHCSFASQWNAQKPQKRNSIQDSEALLLRQTTMNMVEKPHKCDER